MKDVSKLGPFIKEWIGILGKYSIPSFTAWDEVMFSTGGCVGVAHERGGHTMTISSENHKVVFYRGGMDLLVPPGAKWPRECAEFVREILCHVYKIEAPLYMAGEFKYIPEITELESIAQFVEWTYDHFSGKDSLCLISDEYLFSLAQRMINE
jgi:hypothetical protein